MSPPMPCDYGKTPVSLLATLLFIALLVTGISHWFTSRVLNRTVDELQDLRNKTGQLSIRNADHLHVIALPMTEGLQWNWRMHIPPGRKYRLRWVVGHAIPKDEFPEEVASDDFDDVLFSETPPSPLALSARLHDDTTAEDKNEGDDRVEDGHTGQWKLTLRHMLHEVSIPVEFGDDIDWLVRRLRYGPTLAGHSETESFLLGERVVLLRVRRFQVAIGGAYSIAQDPCYGFLVWLEPL